jgi:general secretion pathway protein D
MQRPFAFAFDPVPMAVPLARRAIVKMMLLVAAFVEPARAAAVPPPAPSASIDVPGGREFNSCQKVPAGKPVLRLRFKPDTEITELVSWLSSITCTPFLIPSTVPVKGKKVTILAPEPITAAQAYRLFYAALDSVHLTVEPTGSFLRIVDAGRARMTPLPYYAAQDVIPADKRFITKLVRVGHLDATELVNGVLNRLKGETGDIVAYRDSLIITDTADNVERLVRVVKDFDVPSPQDEKLWLVHVRHMAAADLAARLAEIIAVRHPASSPGGRPGAAVPVPAAMKSMRPGLPGDLGNEMAVDRLAADERSNGLFVVANRRAFQWLLALLRRLDLPPASGNAADRVHTYSCEHADCEELAATLSAVLGVSVVSTGTGVRRPPGGRAPRPPLPSPNAGPPIFENDVRVTADAATNSLLVVSSFRDFWTLRRVIEKLDGPRKQVFIEALVLEVLVDNTRETGVAYHWGGALAFPGSDQSLLLGGFDASKTLGPASLVSSLGGLTGALFGPAIPAQHVQLFGTAVQIPSFGAFLQLLETTNDVNVLSTPSLLISNNDQGEISVGENLPFPGQLLGGVPLPNAAGGLGVPSVGVQRQDVALKLKLTPSVNRKDLIRLEVEQEVSDVSAPNFNGLGPATSKRSARTTVMARDQQTVVIGGLMTDRASQTVEKVPILGDIPVLGFFFRHTTRTVKKSNILIALTPYVIDDLSDLRQVAERKLRERRELIERSSSLEDNLRSPAAVVDRHSRGLLEDINRAVGEIEEDERELRAVRGSEVEAAQLTPASLEPGRP